MIKIKHNDHQHEKNESELNFFNDIISYCLLILPINCSLQILTKQHQINIFFKSTVTFCPLQAMRSYHYVIFSKCQLQFVNSLCSKKLSGFTQVLILFKKYSKGLINYRFCILPTGTQQLGEFAAEMKQFPQTAKSVQLSTDEVV